MNATLETMQENGTNLMKRAIQTPGWIISEIFILLFITTTIWFSISMAVYVYKTGKWKFEKRDFTGGQVLLAAASVGPVTFIRFVLTQSVLLVGYGQNSKNNQICEVLEDSSIFLFAISLIPTYLYLWLRQRTFYLQPSLAKLYTKTVKIISWGCGTFMLISGIIVAVLFIYPHAYQASNWGCILRSGIEEDVLPFFMTTLTLLISQFTLVGLFVYPLIIHRKVQVTMLKQIPEVHVVECSNNSTATSNNNKTNKAKISSSHSLNHHDVTDTHYVTSNSISSSVMGTFKKIKPMIKHTQGGDRVLNAIKRSVVCSVVCILSDITAAATLTFILPRNTPKGITNAVYDFSLYVNILSVIFSFENYKKIFTALCAFKK